jgi:hypothetical protein
MRHIRELMVGLNVSITDLGGTKKSKQPSAANAQRESDLQAS